MGPGSGDNRAANGGKFVVQRAADAAMDLPLVAVLRHVRGCGAFVPAKWRKGRRRLEEAAHASRQSERFCVAGGYLERKGTEPLFQANRCQESKEKLQLS